MLRMLTDNDPAPATSALRTRLFRGTIFHSRRQTVRHDFEYPVTFLAIELDELPDLDRRLRWFGHNRWRPFSVHDADYFDSSQNSIRNKIQNVLNTACGSVADSRITMVTSPRLFGYAFNPVNFYFNWADGSPIHAIVVEVNNTFGQRHCYLLDELRRARSGAFVARAPKQFFVSPFFDLRGEYRFQFQIEPDRIDVRISLVHRRRCDLYARLTGQAFELTDRALIHAAARFPTSAAAAMPRILWQAAKLHFQKGLPVYPNPQPKTRSLTSRRRDSLADHFAKSLVFRALKRLRRGSLQLVLPDHSLAEFGQVGGPVSARMQIENQRVFRDLLWYGEIGLGESYVRGDWNCDNLPELIELFIRNPEISTAEQPLASRIGRAINARRHRLRPNTLSGSRKNIQSHYDLGNDLFESFLDESMSYSCALYASPQDSLESAQRNKLLSILHLADIKSTDHVLEIGSGWGALAILAAQETGCRVTSITLSREQLQLARARIREAGLQDRVAIELLDYRQVRGTFDRIVSVEMIEAVGHENLPSFFAACDRLLAPDGLVVLQAITYPERDYERYRRSSDWIRKHVFPGGHIPSLGAICQAMAKASRLNLERAQNIGVHYARTIADWRERFLRNWPSLAAAGYTQAFRRKWLFYLAYCEAAFATRTLATHQVVLTRCQNRRLPTPPYTQIGTMDSSAPLLR